MIFGETRKGYITMKLINIVVLITFLFSAGCAMGTNIVDFSDVDYYVEASLEKDGYLIIRATIVPNSYDVITKYRFFSEGSNYCLTLQYEAGNKKPCSAIEYTPLWGGIRVTIPREDFNPKTNKMYYKDREGEHEIIIGTKGSWRKHIEERLRKDPDLSEKHIEQILKDI